MSVAAWTNNVGEWAKNKTIWTIEEGEYLGNPVDTQTIHFVFDQFSYKSPTIHGDHKSNFPYSRHVISVANDEPFTVREYFKPGNDVIWDYKVSKSLSLYFPTRFMLSPIEYRNQLDNAMNRVLTIARQRLRDGDKVQYGASLGEAKTTADMIAGNAKAIAASYRALRHGNFGLALKNLGLSINDIASGKAISGKYLEWIYGWMPFMADIHDGVKKLERDHRDPTRTIMAEASFPVKYDESHDGGFLQTRWKCHGAVKCHYEALVVDPFLDQVDSYGLLNPLSVAWELLPFSFVADWFVPVGNVLESLSANAGLEFATGYTNFSNTERFTAHVKAENVINPGYLEVAQYVFNRNVLNGFEMPRFYANMNPFSTPHIKSAVALIRQMT